MANRPPSELFLPKPSVKRRRDDNIEHEILQRLQQQNQSSRPNTNTYDTIRRHTLGAIVEQKWAELHAEDTNDNPQQQPTSNHDPSTPANQSTTRAQTPDHPSSFLFDATPSPNWLNDARHNLRETSQTRATLMQKAADLYATASGIIPPYVLTRLAELGVLDEEGEDPQFPVGLDAAEQIDQVRFFLVQLGRIVDRLSSRASVEMARKDICRAAGEDGGEE